MTFILHSGGWDHYDRTDPLFYLPMGEHRYVEPRHGETLLQLLKRLKRLARSYRARGKAFRVEPRGDRVLWYRVGLGEHTKLVWWYRTEIGVPLCLKPEATKADLVAARQTARYLARKRLGEFVVKIEAGDLFITRTKAADANAQLPFAA